MKKLVIFCLLFVFNLTHANENWYLEGGVGYYKTDKYSTEPYQQLGSNITDIFSHDSSFGGGLELGYSGIMNTNFRTSISYFVGASKIKEPPGQIVNGVKGDLNGYIGDKNSKIHYSMLNLFYDFKNTSSFTPFLGTGVGLADAKDFDEKGALDKEFAWAGYIGINYHFKENLYIGLKGSRYQINELVSKKYRDAGENHDYKAKNIKSNVITFTLGYEF
jgi:opacity protein-like surface antigen